MKKLEDVIENVRYGSVLTINKEKNINNDKYNSCIILYDGRIFKDVKVVELGDFLEMFPNIKNQLDDGYIYQVKYLYEEEKYQSSIMHLIKDGGYKEQPKEEIIHNFKVLSNDFFDSIIALDTKISEFSNQDKQVKKKVIA